MVKSLIVKEKVHERIKRLAKKEGKTVSRITEEAIEEYGDKIEYTAEAFADFVLKNKNLATYTEYFKEEFESAPPRVYKDIISLDQSCEGGEIEFNVSNFPTTKEEMEKIFRRDLRGGFIIFKTKEKELEEARKKILELGKIIESINEEIEDEKTREVNIKITLKRPINHDEVKKEEILIFTCYKKKEEVQKKELKKDGENSKE